MTTSHISGQTGGRAGGRTVAIVWEEEETDISWAGRLLENEVGGRCQS